MSVEDDKLDVLAQVQAEVDKEEPEAVEEVVAEEPQQEDVAEEQHVESDPDEGLSEVELQAKAQGWRPPSEFNEEGKQPISAEEFLRRGELFDKIAQYRKKTESLEHKVEQMTALMQEERVRGYEQALADLEARRREAVEIGDYDTFNEIDSEYHRVREQKSQVESIKSQEVQPEIPEAYVQFQQKNSDWFNQATPENNEMLTKAVQIEEFLAENKPYMSPEQKIAFVESEIKSLYPHRFKNPKKSAPPKVEAPVQASKPASSGKITVNDLSDRQKEIMQQFLALDPEATPEDYLQNLEASLKRRNML